MSTMDTIHCASVSWPLGVKSVANFRNTEKVAKKPRAKTAPSVRIVTPRRQGAVKKGEPFEDLSPRMTKMRQKQAKVEAQWEVPVLRDILEILTCNSTNLQRSRSYSADRVQIMQKTVEKRGVPVPIVDVALKASRRFRHPERLEANLPVTPVRLTNSARSLQFRQSIQEELARLTAVTPKTTAEHEHDVKEQVSLAEVKDKMSLSAECQSSTTSEQIINVVDEPAHRTVNSRENIPTISSGAAGAPPPPPSTPDQQRPPVTPVEKALKRNSATYLYKRNQRKNRARSAVETKCIILATHIETLTPFSSMKTSGYNKNMDYFNGEMNIMSWNTLEQLYKTKEPNNPQTIPTAIIAKQMTISPVNVTRVNKSAGKRYISVKNIRPFTKPEADESSSAIKYVSTYDVNETTARDHVIDKDFNSPAELKSQDVSKNTGKAVSKDTSREGMETNRSVSQHNMIMTKGNTDGEVDDDEKKKSARIAPIVIPCALTDIPDNENNNVNPEYEPKLDEIRQKSETRELTNAKQNVLAASRLKSGVLKVR